MSETIAFRVDASVDIGTGHVMRCLTLAEALRNRGVTCTFICRPHKGNMNARIRACGFELHELPDTDGVSSTYAAADYGCWVGAPLEEDAEDTVAALGEIKPQWLVVDHYGLGGEWEKILRPHVDRVAVLDDLANRSHDCDLLVDQNYTRELAARYTGLVPPDAQCLCGPRYALLRPEYAEARSLIGPRRGPLSRILVFYGGADVHNETGRALRVLSRPEFRHLAVDVVVGANHSAREEVLEQARQHPKIEVHGPRDHLVDLMIDADLALGGGGTTTWERCCVGLPSIVTGVADNQMAFNWTLDQDGAVHFLGHWSQVSDNDLAEALAHYVECPERLGAMGQTAWCITDGLGRLRVAEALMPTDRTRLTLRPAWRTDKALYFDWANDPTTRDNAGNPEPNTWATHDSWFEERLADPDTMLWVVVTPSGLPVGQVCIEANAGDAMIDYSVEPAFLDRGWGMCLLEFAVDAYRTSDGEQPLTEGIQAGRTASRISFSRIGSESVEWENAEADTLSLTILSDAASWINEWVPGLLAGWLGQGYRVRWIHNPKDLLPGDLCFLLGCGQLVRPELLRLHSHNLVVHASDLPKGRGWSPLTWQILEGNNHIPVTLLRAEPEVDSGDVYLQKWLKFAGHELLDELRDGVGDATSWLCRQFVNRYPDILSSARLQHGEPSWYPKRGPADSELEVDLPLRDQFELLRVVDNYHYPAFVRLRGHRYRLRIDKVSP